MLNQNYKLAKIAIELELNHLVLSMNSFTIENYL